MVTRVSPVTGRPAPLRVFSYVRLASSQLASSPRIRAAPAARTSSWYDVVCLRMLAVLLTGLLPSYHGSHPKFVSRFLHLEGTCQGVGIRVLTGGFTQFTTFTKIHRHA